MVQVDYVTKDELKKELAALEESLGIKIQTAKTELRSEFNTFLEAMVELINIKHTALIEKIDAIEERSKASWEKHWGIHQSLDRHISTLEWNCGVSDS